MRHCLNILVGVAILSLLGFVGYELQSKDASTASSVKRVFLNSGNMDTWPLTHTYIWKISPATTKDLVGLCVRMVEAEGDIAPPPLPPPKTGREIQDGWAFVNKEQLEG